MRQQSGLLGPEVNDGQVVNTTSGGNVPWRAGEDVDGDWEKVSKSRQMAEDCLRAELKREFYSRISIVPGYNRGHIPCC